jgi:hypothetical protein
MERGSSSEGYERIPPARRAAILCATTWLSGIGDTGKVSKAHSIFFYAVFGLVIALAAWLIVKAIVTGLGGDDHRRAVSLNHIFF